MHKYLLRVFIAMAAVCAIFFPAGRVRSVGAAPVDELHLAVSESPHSLDPLLSSTTDEQTLALLAFDTLLTVTREGGLAPSLATVVPTLRNGGISRDGKRVIFHLRRNVTWHDGKPFTSADVAFTIHAILDPATPIADRSGYDDIASVETPNAETVVFHLKAVYSPFVTIVGNQFPIVPEHLLEKSKKISEDPFGAAPIGTGPYRFVRQSRGDKIEYVANESYWGGAPKIKRVNVAEIPEGTTQALEVRQGLLDYVSLSSNEFAQLRENPSLVAAITPINDFVAYALNTARPTLANVEVRRAISMAIDREALVRDDTFGTGTVAYADLPLFLWTQRQPRAPYGYDPAAANALLDRVGWHRGPGGVRVRDGKRLHLVMIDFSGSVTGRNLDTQIQQMLAAVGIEIELKYFSLSLYYSPVAEGGPVAKGDFDLAAYDFSSGPDPFDDEIFGCSHREPNGFNAARYCAPAMERLQRASLTELDPVVRRRDVTKIENLAATDLPYIFLYHTPLRVIHSKRLSHSAAAIGSVNYRIGDWSFAR